ncbi:hypothetical protein GCM10010273_07160 [Streptomyces lavendulocolor]
MVPRLEEEFGEVQPQGDVVGCGGDGGAQAADEGRLVGHAATLRIRYDNRSAAPVTWAPDGAPHRGGR